jgi:hypothetical protein
MMQINICGVKMRGFAELCAETLGCSRHHLHKRMIGVLAGLGSECYHFFCEGGADMFGYICTGTWYGQ